MLSNLAPLSTEMPILIAGPTAAGKSTLALEIADRDGGVVVNADALQVFANWRILTARPTDADLALTPHHLYGHVPGDSPYSVGQWLRDITPLLTGPQRPIIVGGTGLYFMALTQGLADIPQTPEHIRTQGNQILAQQGAPALLADIDPVTLARIDAQNPMRVQRAWEVQQTTGRGLAAWQQDTPPPILPLKQAETLLLCADKDWLNTRISNRFDQMLCSGALQEAQDNLASWNPDHPSAKAIGARELISHVAGDMSLDQARDSATTATRQYAKRQRSWFRAKMADWTPINLP